MRKTRNPQASAILLIVCGKRMAGDPNSASYGIQYRQSTPLGSMAWRKRLSRWLGLRCQDTVEPIVANVHPSWRETYAAARAMVQVADGFAGAGVL